MSIEKALEANTKSNLELAEAIRAQTELLTTKLSGGSAKSTEKPAAKEEPEKEAPKKEEKPAAKKSTAKKDKEPELTAETLRDRYQEYMLGAPKGSDARKERIEQCRSVLAYFGVEGVSEIPEDNFEEAVGFIETLENGDELEFPEKEDGDEELPI